MFNIDLKRAEATIAAGRLDDAFSILAESSVRQHRDGQRLIDRLSDALVQRAHLHLENRRFDDARHDAAKAFELGGRKSEIAELKRLIQLKDESIFASNLKSEIDDALASVEDHVTAGRWTAAAQLISNMTPQRAASAEIESLARQVVDELTKKATQEINCGRLDQAAVTFRSLRSLAPDEQRVVETRVHIERCQQIRGKLGSGDFHAAQRELALLSQTVSASWISETQTAMAEIIKSLDIVLSGPLGLVSAKTGAATLPPQSVHVASEIQRVATSSKRSIVLQVDGLGSLLLLRKQAITIGTPSLSADHDVVLQTAGLVSPVLVRRVDADYFVESAGVFAVNGQAVSRRLLDNGDSISIGQRGRFRFSRAVPASGSAVLEVSGAKLARRDLRSIVLLDDCLVFASSAAHFRLPSGGPPILLQPLGDGFTLHQQGESRRQSLQVGHSLVIGDTRFALVENLESRKGV